MEPLQHHALLLRREDFFFTRKGEWPGYFSNVISKLTRRGLLCENTSDHDDHGDDEEDQEDDDTGRMTGIADSSQRFSLVTADHTHQ